MKRINASRILFVLAATVSWGCSSGHSNSTAVPAASARVFSGQHPIKVVCTIGQVAEMLRRVGGAQVAVEALMGPGVDPHLYSPVASDVRKLKNADAIFYNGLHLEGRMAALFEQMAQTKATYAVTAGLVERKDRRLSSPPEFEGLHDPHVWHDPLMWGDCVADVAELLAEFDPPHAADYRQNAEAYRAELTELAQYCREQIAQIPKRRRVLVTAHDAFRYFGAAFDIEVYGLKGISTEEEKDLVHQEQIQQMLVERGIPAVFVESAVAPRTVASLVEPSRAAGLDLQIGGELYADALGPPDSDAADYAGMIRHNVRTIIEALK